MKIQHLKYIYIALLVLIISCNKTKVANISVTKLSNDEINLFEITNKKILDEFMHQRTIKDTRIEKIIHKKNNDEIKREEYYINKNEYENIKLEILNNTKSGIKLKFNIKNSFNENIDHAYMTALLIFEFPNTTKTYTETSQIIVNTWKSNQEINVVKNIVLNYAKGYDDKVFRNHSPKKVIIKIYLHAKNNVGFELNENDKLYHNVNAHLVDYTELNSFEIINKDITDIWMTQVPDIKLLNVKLNNLKFLTPAKFEKQYLAIPNLHEARVAKTKDKVLIYYFLDYKKPITDSFLNSESYNSLENFMKNYIATLENTTKVELNNVKPMFLGESNFDNLSQNIISGKFFQNNIQYLIIGKSYLDQRNGKAQVVVGIYKNIDSNHIEIVKVLNSINYVK